MGGGGGEGGYAVNYVNAGSRASFHGFRMTVKRVYVYDSLQIT